MISLPALSFGWALPENVRRLIVFLEDYDIDIVRFLVRGVDVWLNNPRRPMEASGTSGMKAAVNGVLNMSTLDGWWPEACRHGVNGWRFGVTEQTGGAVIQSQRALRKTLRSKDDHPDPIILTSL